MLFPTSEPVPTNMIGRSVFFCSISQQEIYQNLLLNLDNLAEATRYVNIDEVAKGRHSGENRNPYALQLS